MEVKEKTECAWGPKSSKSKGDVVHCASRLLCRKTQSQGDSEDPSVGTLPSLLPHMDALASSPLIRQHRLTTTTTFQDVRTTSVWNKRGEEEDATHVICHSDLESVDSLLSSCWDPNDNTCVRRRDDGGTIHEILGHGRLCQIPSQRIGRFGRAFGGFMQQQQQQQQRECLPITTTTTVVVVVGESRDCNNSGSARYLPMKPSTSTAVGVAFARRFSLNGVGAILYNFRRQGRKSQ